MSARPPPNPTSAAQTAPRSASSTAFPWASRTASPSRTNAVPAPRKFSKTSRRSTMRPSLQNSGTRDSFRSEEPTWTNSPWAPPAKTPRFRKPATRAIPTVFRRGGRCRRSPRRACIRHRRFHPAALRLLRSRRTQADLWTRLPLRSRRICFVPRPDRPHHQDSGRFRHHA